MNTVVLNFAIGVLLPPFLNLLTKRHVSNDAKKRIVWSVCILIAVCSTGANGVFAPVLEAFHSGVSFQAGIAALWKAAVILVASWGTLVVSANGTYDKVFKQYLEPDAASNRLQPQLIIPPPATMAPATSAPQDQADNGFFSDEAPVLDVDAQAIAAAVAASGAGQATGGDDVKHP